MMNKTAHNDAAMKKYLLGELFGAELDELERQYLADNELFEQLLLVEDDLIDQYARGELNATERTHFERQLLATPGQRERLVNARVLLTVTRAQRTTPVNLQSARSSKWPSWASALSQRTGALAFVTLLLFVIGGGIAVRSWQRNAALKRLEAQRQLAPHKQPEVQPTLLTQPVDKEQALPQKAESPATLPSAGRAPQVATFVLPLTLTRGENATTFVLKPGIEKVRLQLQIAGGGYKRYRAELQSADGDHLQTFVGMKPQYSTSGQVLLFNLPAKILNRNDYVLRLSGIGEDGLAEEAGFFSFRVTRE
jgi:hypothetical protein